MSDEPREMTEEEMTERFIQHIWMLIDYWERESRTPGVRDKMEGVAFSILSFLDGCTLDAPAFDLVPMPHESDKDFHKEEGSNWWPDKGPEALLGVPRISDMLHERFYRMKGDAKGHPYVEQLKEENKKLRAHGQEVVQVMTELGLWVPPAIRETFSETKETPFSIKLQKEE